MITSLDIHNYAIIEQLKLDFSKGLTIITGETGAGKSILLGALGLIMGERSDRKMFYRKDKKCIIEGTFQVKPYQLQPFFDEHELDYDDEVIIRREITVAGKSRAFVNDTPVTLDILRKLTGALIDLHRQFDTQDINDVSFQLRMIDALAGNKEQVKKYTQDYKSYIAKKRELANLITQNSQAAKELDFLNFQINELAQAELILDEDTKLEAAMKKMDNAESIQATLGKVVSTLSGEDKSVQATLRNIATDLAKIAKFEPKIQEQASILDGLILDFEAVADNLEETLSETEVSPEEAIETRARLDLIYRLQKKHQALNVDGLIDIFKDLSSQAKTFTDLGDKIATLQTETDKLKEQLTKKATALSNKRKKVAPGFEKTVSKGLQDLSMPHALLKIDFKTKEDLGATGIDDVSFLFSANKGGELLPVQGVASGGELSRLALVTKSLVAGAIPLPTIIFDEIDAGVSGDVALRMGQILEKLAKGHQVVVITHSPQVAAKAHTHYFIYKKDEATHTTTKVKQLTQEERIKSIAVMLSQNPPSDAALTNAKELMSTSVN